MQIANFGKIEEDLANIKTNMVEKFDTTEAILKGNYKQLKLQPVSREKAQECYSLFLGKSKKELKEMQKNINDNIKNYDYKFDSNNLLDEKSKNYISDQTLKLATIDSLLLSSTVNDEYMTVRIPSKAALLAEDYIRFIQKNVARRSSNNINVVPTNETIQEIGQSINSGFANATEEFNPIKTNENFEGKNLYRNGAQMGNGYQTGKIPRDVIKDVVGRGINNIYVNDSQQDNFLSHDTIKEVVNSGMKNAYGDVSQQDSFLSRDTIKDVDNSGMNNIYGNGGQEELLDDNDKPFYSGVSRTGSAARVGRYDSEGNFNVRSEMNDYSYRPMTDSEIQQARKEIMIDSQPQQTKTSSNQSLIPTIQFEEVFTPAPTVINNNNVKDNAFVAPERAISTTSSVIEQPVLTRQSNFEDNLSFDYSQATVQDMLNAIDSPTISKADIARMRDRIESTRREQHQLAEGIKQREEKIDEIDEDSNSKADTVKEIFEKWTIYLNALQDDNDFKKSKIDELDRIIEDREKGNKKLEAMIKEMSGVMNTSSIDLNIPRGK